MMFYVYGLAEEFGVVRYVGKSKNPRNRLNGHRARSGARAVREWIESIDGRVELRILETCESAAEAAISEQTWIKNLGAGLLNRSESVDTRSSARRERFGGIAHRCASCRSEMGITQNALGVRAGLPIGAIGRLEEGERPHITAESAVAIARVLRVSVEWLVTGEERSEVQAAE